MMIRNDIDVGKLKEMFSYDRATGVISWKIARLGRHPGVRAGTLMTNGYIYIKIKGAYYLAHRIAWAITHGAWPSTQIDHKDGNKINNRLDNLRPATTAQNTRNRTVQTNNRTGLKGVSKHRAGGYFARITRDGCVHYLGYFKTAKEAKAAYDLAVGEHHGEFARA